MHSCGDAVLETAVPGGSQAVMVVLQCCCMTATGAETVLTMTQAAWSCSQLEIVPLCQGSTAAAASMASVVGSAQVGPELFPLSAMPVVVQVVADSAGGVIREGTTALYFHRKRRLRRPLPSIRTMH